MNILVTAGNTVSPIDRVRCITNIFTGKTGARIALHAHERGHSVRLLTSHPEVIDELRGSLDLQPATWSARRYRTFDGLRAAMAEAIQPGGFDGVIHCAAVNDYHAAGIFAPGPGTCYNAASGSWTNASGGPPVLVDRAAGKVKSDESELWLRMVRAPKLIDFIRPEWGFRGVLVKFKLEVGVSESALLEVGERSRRQSAADLMVANTLEGAASWAYLGPVEGRYHRIDRSELPSRLLSAVETLHQERRHG